VGTSVGGEAEISAAAMTVPVGSTSVAERNAVGEVLRTKSATAVTTEPKTRSESNVTMVPAPGDRGWRSGSGRRLEGELNNGVPPKLREARW
jgi:hypothetical protein